MKNAKNLYRILLTILTITAFNSAKAQLNPMMSQYFNNQYLGNPALAGSQKGFGINAGYRQQWSNIPGSPTNQVMTAEYGFEKVGLGLYIQNDKIGLQRQTRVVATYAYHLPLNNNDRLSFGLSFGFMNQRLQQSDIQGDGSDILVGRYNAREAYLDGDFGVAYTSRGLNIQAAFPNLKTLFKKETIKVADVSTFYSAVSYKIPLNKGADAIGIEPKVAFRGVKGYKNIIDAGAQVSFSNETLFFTGMYHSSQSATFGVGFNFKRKLLISGMYTSETSKISGYANGNFELNLGVRI